MASRIGGPELLSRSWPLQLARSAAIAGAGRPSTWRGGSWPLRGHQARPPGQLEQLLAWSRSTARLERAAAPLAPLPWSRSIEAAAAAPGAAQGAAGALEELLALVAIADALEAAAAPPGALLAPCPGRDRSKPLPRHQAPPRRRRGGVTLPAGLHRCRHGDAGQAS